MTSGGACPGDETVAHLVDGTLGAARRTAILAHAADCGSCRVLLSELVQAPRTAREVDEPNAPSRLEGTVLDRYALLEPVGAGGMGVVYAAHDRQLERRVALKLLRETASDGPRRRSLLREARAMAKLAHPNVVRVFDVGEHEGRVFVTMEFVDGGTLREHLESEAHNFAHIASLFEGAGRGLAAAHRAGVVHRDFKPENVLIREGTALVSDFGLARLTTDAAAGSEAMATPGARERTTSSARSSAVAGTLHYMAPEQLRGESVDARSDLFGYCVAFWESLFGEKPFRGATPAELLAAIEAGPPEPRRAHAVPRATVAALRAGLAYSPEERPPTMESFLSAAMPTSEASRGRVVLPATAAIAVAVAVFAIARADASSTAETPSAAVTSTAPPAHSEPSATSLTSTAPPAPVEAPPPPPRSAVAPTAPAPAKPRPTSSTTRAEAPAPEASAPRGPGGVFVRPPF
ncbi:MAG: hypothetical protein BGO98_41055 [Myxococcales bacterium 68-20]|nr:serine/threonine protein kinase [Myxococcales bacterium]OJY27655.1 MAG: hypothetical protein BGO98_41055 [Myxococcales bacterium 68-20]